MWLAKSVARVAENQTWQWQAVPMPANYLKRLQVCKHGFNKNLIHFKN